MRDYVLRRIALTSPVIALATFGAFAPLRMISGIIVGLTAGTPRLQADTKRLEKSLGQGSCSGPLRRVALDDGTSFVDGKTD